MDNFFKERKDYQRYIIDYLVDENKFIERYDNQGHFNPIYAMDTELVIKFLEETQPDKIEQIRKYGPTTRKTAFPFGRTARGSRRRHGNAVGAKRTFFRL